MRILGIDPGVDNVGWGIITKTTNQTYCIECSTIKTSNKDPLARRLAAIILGIEEVILNYTPTHVAVEQVFINKNPLSSMKLCHARGAILATCGKHCLIVAEVAPNRIKKDVVGAGHADKQQVAFMLRRLLVNAHPNTPDEADALAVAYSFANRTNNANHTNNQQELHT